MESWGLAAAWAVVWGACPVIWFMAPAYICAAQCCQGEYPLTGKIEVNGMGSDQCRRNANGHERQGARTSGVSHAILWPSRQWSLRSINIAVA
jgi:hypothetical protein